MSILSYKCPNCGGELVFEPDSGNYVCHFCRSVFTQQQLDELTPKQGSEQKIPAGEADDAPETPEGAGAVVYNCPSCGAQIVTDETTAATFCYYCHNPVVLEGRVSGDFLPDKIIPFKIGRESAVSKFLEYVSKKKFVPRAFFNEEQIEKMTGVYYPYWVYNSSMDSEIDGTATRIRVWRVGNTEYTETSRYEVARGGRISLDSITRNALRKTDRQLVENVQPFDLSRTEKFSMGYLSGFVAEKRDMEKAEFSDSVHEETRKYAASLLKETIKGYGTVHVDHEDNKMLEEQFSYVLLPVWVLTYRSRAGKIFYYAMNGQTGQIYGELPLDGKKVGILSSLIFLIVSVAAMIFGYFM